jgi:xylose dehydrogenase (NAD/NADP)
MSQKVRWGILSTAKIGQTRVVPAIHDTDNGEVVAVASRDLARAQAFARQLNIPTAYGSYEELLADPEIDAIYNPLPNSQHAYWSMRCADAGKPTLCEKPLARSGDEAQAMVDYFKARDILFAEAFMYRFHPQTQQVKRLLHEGAIGQLTTMQASFTFAISDENNIRLSRELAGGSLMDVGCYCVNVMRLMTGEEPDRVSGAAAYGPRTGVDEWLAGVLGFPSGVVGHFDCSLRTFFSHTYELRGTQGRILVEEAFVMDALRGTVIRHWQGSDYREIVVPAANSYTLMAHDFADALLRQRPPRYDPQDGVDNMRVIDRLLASTR